MRKEKVISNYKGLSDNELAALSGKIVGAMTDNSNFVDPIPALDDLTEAVSDYRTKHEVAIRGGSLLDIRIKNQSRKALLYQLSQLAHYVNTEADGDIAVLTSSAMILAKQPNERSLPYQIERVMLKDGNLSGQLRVDLTPQPGVWEYEIQLGTWASGETSILWGASSFTTVSKGNILAPLEPGVRYHVRARARNGRGSGDWTEPVSMIVR